MKKIIYCCMLIILSAKSFSQETNSLPVLTKQDYLLKSKHQKTAAWILLGGGSVLTIIGVAIGINDVANNVGGNIVYAFGAGPEPGSPSAIGPVLFFTGIASMLGSIPLFISSSHNKNKALILSFKNEMVPQLSKQNLVYQTVPSLTLKISL